MMKMGFKNRDIHGNTWQNDGNKTKRQCRQSEKEANGGFLMVTYFLHKRIIPAEKDKGKEPDLTFWQKRL